MWSASVSFSENEITAMAILNRMLQAASDPTSFELIRSST
jgi:hypothetical protein